jgi:serine/threonine protein kinase
LEYIEGRPLAGPLAGSEAVRVALQIAAALEAAQAKGILHRDLKPANILRHYTRWLRAAGGRKDHVALEIGDRLD